MAKKEILKNKKKKLQEEKKKKASILAERTKNLIFGILMFLMATIIVLAFFDLSGGAGEIFMKTFSYLLGKAVFVLPFLFVLAGLSLWSKSKKYRAKMFVWTAIFAILISIIGITGVLQCLSDSNKYGGEIGFLVSWPVLNFFGKIVGELIFVAIIFIAGLIFWQFFSGLRPKKEIKPLEEKTENIKKVFDLEYEQVKPKFEVKEVEPEIKRAGDIPSEDIHPKIDANASNEREKANFKDSLYKFPPLELLDSDKGTPTSGDIKASSNIIKRTFQNFDIPVEMSGVNVGPTVTQYTLKPAEGIKLSRITTLSNDLSLALATHPIRIEAPIPGRSLVGIELPNKLRAIVRLRNLLEDPIFQNSTSNLIFAIGRDVSGNAVFADIGKMPHLLVAGSTGSGKTVCLDNIIISLLYQNSPETLRFILIDPKRVEFSVYNNFSHLLCPVVIDAQRAVNVLKWLISEMERRFEVLSEFKSKDINSFNEEMSKKGKKLMPWIVLVIDELADLMMSKGKEVEAGIVRLAQMARAVGIHLIIATQRPSVEVITGLIKANVTSRIAFQVASQVDSRTILDLSGAEKLLGAGDMLFVSAEVSMPKRIQGAYLSEKEIKKIVSWANSELKERALKPEDEKQDELAEGLQKSLEIPETGGEDFYDGGEQDILYEDAKNVVIEARRASASLLQRRLRIGYARAARLIDMLEERKVVGPSDGARPREVYVSGQQDDWEDEEEEYRLR
ncbi:MAG: DNA translocase FtsK [Patescibacteria group bacterium]|nr:DNA translocase FtsK [Patescibacteria group bacterium]